MHDLNYYISVHNMNIAVIMVGPGLTQSIYNIIEEAYILL